MPKSTASFLRRLPLACACLLASQAHAQIVIGPIVPVPRPPLPVVLPTPAVSDATCIARLASLHEKSRSAQIQAVLVTNDARSQLVTYLTGKLGSGASALLGGMQELVSSHADCRENVASYAPEQLGTCTGALQPFSVAQQEFASLSVGTDRTVTITWPGGGKTVDKLWCASNGNYFFHRSYFSGVLSLVPANGPR